MAKLRIPKKGLTEDNVAEIEPPTDRQFENYYDTLPGFFLRVNSGGRKSFCALYYRKAVDKDGNRITVPTTHKLGLYPHLKVKEAREAARKFLANPQKALQGETGGTFKEVAEEFIKRHVEQKQLRSQADIERLLNKQVYPVWQHHAFRELKRSDVRKLLDKIADDHGLRQADMVLAIIRKMMNWYQSRNDDYVSPIVRGMAAQHTIRAPARPLPR